MGPASYLCRWTACPVGGRRHASVLPLARLIFIWTIFSPRPSLKKGKKLLNMGILLSSSSSTVVFLSCFDYYRTNPSSAMGVQYAAPSPTRCLPRLYNSFLFLHVLLTFYLLDILNEIRFFVSPESKYGPGIHRTIREIRRLTNVSTV